MLITVAICTRNRAASLARTLASIERCKRLTCDWELLVTDNGSSDDTRMVVDSFRPKLPIRLQVEPTPGVANARNAAVAAARGIYMVCTDDDTVVDPDWLAAYETCFSQWPTADLFAGKIVPVLEEPQVRWFQQAARQLGGPLAMRDMGDSPKALAADNECVPYGANCAVRVALQRAFLFDPRRGPGKTYFGEETTSYMAMLQAGHYGRWVPDACVQHMISPKRQTEAYIRWWYEGLGRTLVWEGTEVLEGPTWFGVPRWLWRQVVTQEIKFRVARRRGSPEVWVKRLIDASLFWGQLRHCRHPAAK